jgi:hypothetical protein
MQDDKKQPNDLGTAHEVILVQSESLVKLKEKNDELHTSLQEALAESVPYDIFDFLVSRHRDGPQEILRGYEGHVMADCYSGNMSVVLTPGSKMTRMACWAHATERSTSIMRAIHRSARCRLR